MIAWFSRDCYMIRDLQGEAVNSAVWVSEDELAYPMQATFEDRTARIGDVGDRRRWLTLYSMSSHIAGRVSGRFRLRDSSK